MSFFNKREIAISTVRAGNVIGGGDFSADRIIHMENGEIIESGSHRELMAAGSKYAEMFRLQTEKYQHV